jgi:hypothetical protein
MHRREGPIMTESPARRSRQLSLGALGLGAVLLGLGSAQALRGGPVDWTLWAFVVFILLSAGSTAIRLGERWPRLSWVVTAVSVGLALAIAAGQLGLLPHR